MDTPQTSTSPSPRIRLNAAERDDVYLLVANEMNTIGHVLARDYEDITAAHMHEPRLRVLLALLDDIGWSREDPRDTFEVHDRDELAALLKRGCDNIDALLHGESAGPEDADTWHRLDRLLEQVTGS